MLGQSLVLWTMSLELNSVIVGSYLGRPGQSLYQEDHVPAQ